VTSPETYPIWKTRKPVILLWNRRHGSSNANVLHHYYRYLVVSPGTVRNPHVLPNVAVTGGSSGGTATTSTSTIVQASTSSETTNTGSTIVLEWEDPFHTVTSTNTQQDEASVSGSMSKSLNVSAVSLNSSAHLASMNHTGTQFRNLPYRTIDVNYSTSVIGRSTTSDNTAMIMNAMDHWNNADDPTFQPFRIRDAVRILSFCTVRQLVLLLSQRFVHCK
jgi:hypothetical protein